jgi:hypothetical protein
MLTHMRSTFGGSNHLTEDVPQEFRSRAVSVCTSASLSNDGKTGIQ